MIDFASCLLEYHEFKQEGNKMHIDNSSLWGTKDLAVLKEHYFCLNKEMQSRWQQLKTEQ